MKCENCGNDLDFDYMVEEDVRKMLENSKDKEDLKNYLDKEFDFSINQACDACYHTLWIEGEDRKLYYEKLEEM